MSISAFIQSLVDTIGGNSRLALVVVFLVSAGEALFVIGLFVPSTVVLVAAGGLIGLGTLSFWPVYLAATAGAVLGDAISFWFGHVWKQRVRQIWPFSRYGAALDKGEAFFHRHGGKSVFIGRFIPGVKAVVPGIAGMMGMGITRFTVINVVSAFAWAGAHIIPAIALGRGFDLAKSANPRLAVLLVALTAILVLAWYLTKLTLGFALPHLDRFRQRLADNLKPQNTRLARWGSRVLLNEEGALLAFALAVLGLFASAGFVLLVANLLFEPELTASDSAVSTFLQSFRNAPADRIMTLITMLADSVVLATVAVAFVLLLAVLKRWRLALMSTVAFTGGALFVPLAKSLLHRARPLPHYSGAEAFSFPSGHATLSITIIGVIVLILAHNLPRRWKTAAYAATTVLLTMIAFSRIYLLAHWPSDVLAGLLFGGSVVILLAFLLHGRRIELPAGRIAMVLGLLFVATFGWHVDRGFVQASDVYSRSLPVESMTVDQWIGGGWQKVPDARILFDGEFAEPLIFQTNLTVETLEKVLTSGGWQKSKASWWESLLAHIVPSRGSLADIPPLHTYNSGSPAVAIFSREDRMRPDTRLVLNIWPTRHVIVAGAERGSLLTGSVTKEKTDPLPLGWLTTETVARAAGENAGAAKDLTALAASAGAEAIPVGDSLVLIRK